MSMEYKIRSHNCDGEDNKENINLIQEQSA